MRRLRGCHLGLTCGVQLPHVCVHQRHSGAARAPASKQLILVGGPLWGRADWAILEEDLIPVLQGVESAATEGTDECCALSSLSWQTLRPGREGNSCLGGWKDSSHGSQEAQLRVRPHLK